MFEPAHAGCYDEIDERPARQSIRLPAGRNNRADVLAWPVGWWGECAPEEWRRQIKLRIHRPGKIANYKAKGKFIIGAGSAKMAGDNLKSLISNFEFQIKMISPGS